MTVIALVPVTPQLNLQSALYRWPVEVVGGRSRLRFNREYMLAPIIDRLTISTLTNF
jgi:hypothetical protein